MPSAQGKFAHHPLYPENSPMSMPETVLAVLSSFIAGTGGLQLIFRAESAKVLYCAGEVPQAICSEAPC